jgi:putative addiction module component (TIGR02574 family)
VARRAARQPIDLVAAFHYNVDVRKTVMKLRNDALALSPSERASLAHDLILSLDDPADYTLSPEQEVEIQRRVQQVREGQAQGRSAEDVFGKIRPRRR